MELSNEFVKIYSNVDGSQSHRSHLVCGRIEDEIPEFLTNLEEIFDGIITASIEFSEDSIIRVVKSIQCRTKALTQGKVAYKPEP